MADQRVEIEPVALWLRPQIQHRRQVQVDAKRRQFLPVRHARTPPPSLHGHRAPGSRASIAPAAWSGAAPDARRCRLPGRRRSIRGGRPAARRFSCSAAISSLQTRRRRSRNIVPGDVDAGDQPFLGKSCHLGNDEYPTMKCRPRLRASAASVCRTCSLAPLERGMRAQHRQRWQAPQQNERPSRDASSPMAAADENDTATSARRSQNDVSRPAQQDQIRIVLVGCREDRGQPRRARARMRPMRLRICMENEEGLCEEIGRDDCPYQTRFPTRAHKPRLHGNCIKILNSCRRRSKQLHGGGR